MFSKYTKDIPNAKEYLDRINATEKCEITKEYLDHLIYQHQISVPFENIDIRIDGKQVSLAIDDLFEKIVRQRRGGVCFELNAIFYGLLKALGFEAFPCQAQVCLGVPFATPSLHRVNMVAIDDRLFYCDVGFGGPEPAGALELIPNVVQEVRGEKYRFVKDSNPYSKNWLLEMGLPNGEFIPAMQVTVAPVSPIDFIAPCHFICCKEQDIMTRFSDLLLLNIRLPEGSASVTNDEYKKHINGVENSQTIDNSTEMVSELANTFKLSENVIRHMIEK